MGYVRDNGVDIGIWDGEILGDVRSHSVQYVVLERRIREVRRDNGEVWR